MPEPALVDDSTIADTSPLWRRVHSLWIVRDDNTNGTLLSSAAFDDSADGSALSVLLADVVVQTRRTTQDILAGYQGYGLATITVGAARKNGQGVAATPETNKPAHASVFGPKTKSNKRRMAKAATWVVEPGTPL